MKNLLVGAVLALSVSACAQMQAVKDTVASSPEARIVNGSNAGKGATALAGVLLKNQKITKAQATSYSAILHATNDHLLAAEKDLIACRTRTGSTPKTVPDPCEPSVAEDIALAFALASDVKKVLEAKQ